MYKLALQCLAAGTVLAVVAGCRTPQPAAQPPGEATASLSPEQQAFSEALALFSQGLILEMRRDFSGALDAYRLALQLDPDNEELCFRLSMGLLHQKRTEEAVAIMEGLIGRHPRSPKGLRWMALIYRAADRYDDSVRTYQRIIDLSPEDPTPYIQLASLYVRYEQDQKAIKLLESAVDRVESPVDLLRALGEIYLKKGTAGLAGPENAAARKDAIRVLEKIVTAEPDDLFVLNKLGELHILNGEINQAVKFFEQIEQEHPDDLNIKQRLAESFLAVGNKERAVEVLEKVAAASPDNPQVYFYLGELYQQLGDKAKAVSSFRKAADANPLEPGPFLRIALLKLDSDPEGAAEALRQGLDGSPESEKLTEMLAYVHMSQGEYAKAAQQFESALAIIATNEVSEATPNFYFNYAITAQRAEQIETASRMLSRAMEANGAYLDAYAQFVFRQEDGSVHRNGLNVLEELARERPEEPRVHYYRAMLYSYVKDYDPAVAAFERAEKLSEDAPDAAEILSDQFYFAYGAALERSKRFPEAEVAFERCLELNSDHAEAYNYLAYMWAERGEKLDRALDYVRKALAIDPESGAFMDTLGWVYYMQGKYEAALTEIERAAQRLPDDPTVIDHLGDVLLKLGAEDKAVPQWKRSYTLDPDNEKVADKLASRGIDLQALKAEAQPAPAAPEPALPPESELLLPRLDPPGEEEPSLEPVPADGEIDGDGQEPGLEPVPATEP